MLALAHGSAGTAPEPCALGAHNDCPFDAHYCEASPDRPGECAMNESDVEAKCGAWDACGAVLCSVYGCYARTSAQVLWGSQGSDKQWGYVKRPPPPPAGKRCAGASAGLLPAQCDAWIALFDALRLPNASSTYQQQGPAPLKCASPLNQGREDPCSCRTASGNKPLCGRNGTAITNVDFRSIASATGTLPAAVAALTSLRSFVLTGTKVRRQPSSARAAAAARCCALPLPLLPGPPPPPRARDASRAHPQRRSPALASSVVRHNR